jgi:hypothetical protein
MVQITRNGGGAPQADPRREFVYYAKGTAPSELWRVPAGGGDEVRVIDRLSNNGNFAVTRDGIYYIPPQDEHGRTSIEFLNLQTGRSKTILPLDRAPMWGLTVSPDRRSILHVQLDDVTSDLMLVENFR